jgi:ParB-like chromosome segregation protein Spo0J
MPGIKLEIHPAAAIFPMMSDDELKELAKSITAFDLREKIGVLPGSTVENGQTIYTVIDGRNRLEALRRLKVKDDVIFENFVEVVDPADFRATPEEYVLLANIERRNLTRQQRRDLAGKLAVMLAERQKDLPKEQQTDTLSEAAKKAGVSRRTAATAKQQTLKLAGAEPTKKPQRAKTPAQKKAMAGPTSAVIIKRMQEGLDSLQTYGHNMTLDALQTIIGLARTTVEVSESKLGVVAEHAKKEADEIAAKAAEAAARVAEAHAKK